MQRKQKIKRKQKRQTTKKMKETTNQKTPKKGKKFKNNWRKKEETKKNKICNMFKKIGKHKVKQQTHEQNTSMHKGENTEKQSEGWYIRKNISKKENNKVKKRFFPKRNFRFKKRILANGEISQEMTHQDTKGYFTKAKKKRSKEK